MEATASAFVAPLSTSSTNARGGVSVGATRDGRSQDFVRFRRPNASSPIPTATEQGTDPWAGAAQHQQHYDPNYDAWLDPRPPPPPPPHVESYPGIQDAAGNYVAPTQGPGSPAPGPARVIDNEDVPPPPPPTEAKEDEEEDEEEEQDPEEQEQYNKYGDYEDYKAEKERTMRKVMKLINTGFHDEANENEAQNAIDLAQRLLGKHKEDLPQASMLKQQKGSEKGSNEPTYDDMMRDGFGRDPYGQGFHDPPRPSYYNQEERMDYRDVYTTPAPPRREYHEISEQDFFTEGIYQYPNQEQYYNYPRQPSYYNSRGPVRDNIMFREERRQQGKIFGGPSVPQDQSQQAPPPQYQPTPRRDWKNAPMNGYEQGRMPPRPPNQFFDQRNLPPPPPPPPVPQGDPHEWNFRLSNGRSPQEQMQLQQQESFISGSRNTYFSPGNYGGA